MKLPIILAASLLMMTAVAQKQNPRPTFSDFPVKKIWKGAPAAPKIEKDYRMFRTRIRLGAKAPVAFAGHYTVPGWGCGASCESFVIVDSITGRVYGGFPVTDLPLTWIEEHQPAQRIDERIEFPERIEFHPGSRLLKINGCLGEQDCGFYDYEMVDGKGLELIRKELLPEQYQPECVTGTWHENGCSTP